MIIQQRFMSPVGLLYLTASDQGLMRVAWTKDTSVGYATSDILSETKRQLEEYFMKKRSSFDIPLILEGTEFQKKVWNELQKIPSGSTISYKTLAKRIGSPDASQAVGTANGKNPICIIVPCHRVVSSTGKLSGYIAGKEIKGKLLELEGVKKYENDLFRCS